MEHCPVCETLVQATSTAAATIHRYVVPCERLFHASCAGNKSPIANDDIDLPGNHPVVPQEFVLLPSSSNLWAQSDEDRLPAILYEDNSNEDLLIGYFEIVEDLILELLERITILRFLMKCKKTLIKIAMIF